MIHGALGSRYAIGGALGRSVKRALSTAFLPTDITGCVLWYDCSDSDTMFTDAGTTKVSANGQAVYQVNDKSGQLNHAQQSTENKRPLYKTSIKNSLSAIYSDGNNDSLIVPNLTLTNYSVFFAYQYIARGLLNVGFAWDNYNTTPRQALVNYIFRSDQMDYEVYVNNTGGLVENTGTPSSGDSFIFEAFRDGTAFTANRNGSGITGKTVGTGEFSMVGHRLFTHYYSGAEQSQYAKMYLYEYIIYNSALSSGNATLVRNYINTKWAIYS